MTNFEKIKAMSVEEMADFLTENPSPFCENQEFECIYGWHESDCRGHAKQWLESEVEENG